MSHHTPLITMMVVGLVLAFALGALAHRFRVSPLVGYLLAGVLIGPFSRGGKSRRGTRGADHDFKPWGKLTPFGIFLPDQKEFNLYFTASKVTSDFIADRLEQWWQGNRERYPRIRKLLLDLDNGPENHSRRSQFIYRLVRWA